MRECRGRAACSWAVRLRKYAGLYNRSAGMNVLSSSVYFVRRTKDLVTNGSGGLREARTFL